MASVEDAVEFLRIANDAESDMRDLGLTDLKFRYGEQWPQYAIASRGLDRPQLTINEIDSYIRQVTNNQRQQRPRIKVHPCDDRADVKIAKVIEGLTRHIEVNSNADNAYDTAFDFAATMGFGYWRLRTDYIDEMSFNQDIYIDTIHNPFSVYFDPASREPDGSDAEKCLISDWMPKTTFKKLYPDAEMSSFIERGTGDNDPDWVTTNEVRIAEYFYVDREKAKLVALSDGTLVWSDELPAPELLQAAGITVQGDRDSFKRIVRWCKQTAAQVLEEKKLPGRWIPVVPTYFVNTWVDGKRTVMGLVRQSMDAQRMVNFWQTAITEYLALAPKAKWLLPEGADEGHENEFKNANLSPNPVLRYKTTGVDGQQIPPPQRIAPEPVPAGLLEAAMSSNQNLQRVMGMFDPAVRAQEPKSGKAIIAEKQQSDMSNFHGYDNLTRSIKHTGRIILSYIPVIYDTQRIQRIIGEDGKPDLVTLNEKVQGQDEMGQAIEQVKNNLKIGTYDVVMDTGPGYDTKRLAGVDSMIQLMGTPIGEKVAQVGDDLLVRQMDFPGADVLADRLAAANPLSQIDEQSDIPPKVQMAIKAMQQQLQQAGQTIQGLQAELKYKMGIEQMRQAGEDKRELMRVTTKAHDIETIAQTKQHDTEVRALTAQNVEELKGLVQLLLHHMDTGRLEKEISLRNKEQQAKDAEFAGVPT